MDCSLPGFSVHGISQARILEWVAISFSRGSSRPRGQTCVSGISCTGILYHWATREVPLCCYPALNPCIAIWVFSFSLCVVLLIFSLFLFQPVPLAFLPPPLSFILGVHWLTWKVKIFAMGVLFFCVMPNIRILGNTWWFGRFCSVYWASQVGANGKELASHWALVVKSLPANAGDVRGTGSMPRSGRSPGGGHGNPLQYSCLENFHGQRSLAGYSP